MIQTSDTSGEANKLPPPVIHEFAPVARALLGCDSRSKFVNGDNRAMIVKLVGEAIELLGPGVLSLDVFDTFLLRNDKSEARRFREIAQLARERVFAALGQSAKSLPDDLDFLTARTDATALCYRTRQPVEGCREGHIRDILRTAAGSLGFPPGADAVMLEAELDYEAANLTLNLALVDVGREFRARGGRTILLSDMYLGKDEITAIIRRLDPPSLDLFDDVFSSADHVLSKRSGRIFKLVEQKFDAMPEQFFHIGDAFEGDVYQSKKAGWGALHFPVSVAEHARRSLDLASFASQMKTLGLDVTPWAKV
jgi:FMN phosphatase YigB (HAD superfamily)